jgi:hypothetical protein
MVRSRDKSVEQVAQDEGNGEEYAWMYERKIIIRKLKAAKIRSISET